MPQRKRPVRSQVRKQRQKQPPSIPRTIRHAIHLIVERYRTTGQLVRDQVLELFLNDEIRPQAVAWSERLILRQRTIDRVLKECVSRPVDQVQAPLWTILRMGANELLFGPADSQHAAISETVELCRLLTHPEWTGFVNGVLRGVQRLLTEEVTSELSANAYPFENHEYRVLNKEIFPDLETHFPNYMGFAFSLPESLIREWHRRYPREEFIELCWSTLEAPPMHVRLNRIAVDPARWIERCREAEIAVSTTDVSESIRIDQKVRLSNLPGFEAGEFVVQDITATHAAKLLNPYPGQRVLDLCAGPGTKTTQLAELMLDRGELLATEVSPRRIEQIEENAERLQISCIKTLLIDREDPYISEEPFDAILIDAPCSNTAVLGKRAEARWRYSITELHLLNDIQMQLLDTAAELLAEEGRMVYSTCSIEPKENEQLVSRWLEDHPEFTCTEMKSILPNTNRDGGFCARIERIEVIQDKMEE
ncbi:transcription antitermination factor NusB [Rubinisphaera sp.]|uniref:RsmB/NOP family class I SAM-dependent RNA methyltransferase n=1 Tax=Rubinisphaera sp. TaxID=2024857 RepID=UPI000C10ED52|nr:transcription antitermination factor NusB [Rubinisphaera sp.]MBV09785.1 hypothetical protein [Rubinisphaera sp.]HCS55009.1 hypothetical protein [Planctomycetaceae bacterium]|tara:strand:- start:7770 stop:9206 length:1437 start_codon:yes stop_codon:yes gene_type:complete